MLYYIICLFFYLIAQNPYTAEDLANAYQTIVCEWASTVLSRKMTNLEDLAKYLLRNRFVQTRSCAALTVTASMKDSDGNIRGKVVIF